MIFSQMLEIIALKQTTIWNKIEADNLARDFQKKQQQDLELMGDSTMFLTPPNSTMGGLLPHFFVLKIKSVNFMLSS